jgi:hypothetical protein
MPKDAQIGGCCPVVDIILDSHQIIGYCRFFWADHSAEFCRDSEMDFRVNNILRIIFIYFIVTNIIYLLINIY